MNIGLAVLAAISSTADTIQLPSGIWGLTPTAAAIGMMVFLFTALARGWVIPKASHERELAYANKRGDEWKETALERGALIREQSEQISILVESTKTSAEFFGTVMRDGGGKHVAQEAASGT